MGDHSSNKRRVQFAVADAIHGLSVRSADHKIFLTQFADYIHLYFREAISLCIWVLEDWSDPPATVPRWQSFRDVYLASAVPLPLSPADCASVIDDGGRYYLSVHPVVIDSPLVLRIGESCKDRIGELRTVLGLLQGEVVEVLCSSIHEHVVPRGQPEGLDGTRPTELQPLGFCEGGAHHFPSIRTVLDGVYSTLHDAAVIATRTGELRLNLFAVMRYVAAPSLRQLDGSSPDRGFDYTASLCLSSTQQDEIRTLFARLRTASLEQIAERVGTVEGAREAQKLLADIDGAMGLLEAPKQQGARSVSDSSFQSGIVDFSSSKGHAFLRDFAGNSAAEGHRILLERLVYHEIYGGWSSTAFRIFYVPIHVAGCPWLSLLTFVPDCQEKVPWESSGALDAWQSTYLFYRDAVPSLANAIRANVRSEYLRLAAKPIVEALQTSAAWGKSSTAMNDCWSRLAQVCPYPVLQIPRSVGASAKDRITIALPEPYRSLTLAVTPNHFLRASLQFDALGRDDIEASLQQQVDTASAAALRAAQSESLIRRGVIHEVRALLTGSLKPAISDAYAAAEAHRLEEAMRALGIARHRAEDITVIACRLVESIPDTDTEALSLVEILQHAAAYQLHLVVTGAKTAVRGLDNAALARRLAEWAGPLASKTDAGPSDRDRDFQHLVERLTGRRGRAVIAVRNLLDNAIRYCYRTYNERGNMISSEGSNAADDVNVFERDEELYIVNCAMLPSRAYTWSLRWKDCSPTGVVLDEHSPADATLSLHGSRLAQVLLRSVGLDAELRRWPEDGSQQGTATVIMPWKGVG